MPGSTQRGGRVPTRRDSVRQAYVDKARFELGSLAARGAVMVGNAFSSVLLLKGEPSAAERDGAPPLSGPDGTALRASLRALGYAPEDWAALSTCADDGRPLPADLVGEAIAALDPATLVACDEGAARALREAYADDLSAIDDFDQAMLVPGTIACLRGMRVLNLGGFEAALSDPAQKQVMWSYLKRLAPLGEPY